MEHHEVVVGVKYAQRKIKLLPEVRRVRSVEGVRDRLKTSTTTAGTP